MAPGGGADSAVAPTTTGNESNALAPPSYWIQVLLVDEWGDPVSGVRVFFDFDDGNQQAAVTAADGLASVMKQPNQGVMVRLEGNIFYTNESGEGLYEDPHESTRTLGAEELLADVAARHDLADSRLIYHYPRNAELRASRVALGLVTAGDTMIVPRDYAWYFHTKPATFPHALRLVVPALLEIVSLDPFFAPTQEKHHITYRIARLSKKEKLVVTITSPLYTDDILFTKELAGGALADGVHTLAWEGKTNCTSGDMVEEFIHPLLSPYHVHLFVEEHHQARAHFRVLYHSLEFHRGHYTADEAPPPQSEQQRWARYRLNELGYPAGPIDGEYNSLRLANVIAAFKRGHHVPGTDPPRLFENDGVLTDDTLAALAVAKPRPVWEKPDAPLTEDNKLWVYDNYYAGRGESFYYAGEFDTANRAGFAEVKLLRPFVPLEVEVLLRARNGKGVSAPAAVGPAVVAFEVLDDPEESVISARTNSLAVAFVAAARQPSDQGIAAAPPAADNAPESHNGIRSIDAAANVQSWFPELDSLPPFQRRGFATEDRDGVTHHRALVEVYRRAQVKTIDLEALYPKRFGRAGILLHPSHIGGDTARVRAALSFMDRPNEAELLQDHASAAARSHHPGGLASTTGKWTVWRRSRVNIYCPQVEPERGRPDWSAVAKAWSEAFISMENDGAPDAVLRYTDLVDEDAYKTAIVDMPAAGAPYTRPAGVSSKADLVYRPGSIYGGMPMTRSRAAENDDVFIEDAQSKIIDWVWNAVRAVLSVIHAKVRQQYAEGMICVDYRIHEPIVGWEWVADNWSVDAKEQTGHWEESGGTYNIQYRGFVSKDGVVTLNVDNWFDPSGYFLHEGSHARFLRHHVTAAVEKGQGDEAPSENKDHHDPAQRRCAMSYRIAEDDVTSPTEYPLCGGCILRLRGWRIPPDAGLVKIY